MPSSSSNTTPPELPAFSPATAATPVSIGLPAMLGTPVPHRKGTGVPGSSTRVECYNQAMFNQVNLEVGTAAFENSLYAVEYAPSLYPTQDIQGHALKPDTETLQILLPRLDQLSKQCTKLCVAAIGPSMRQMYKKWLTC